MSKRGKKNTLPDAKDKRIAGLEQQLAQALALIQKLQQHVEFLKNRVEELERAGKQWVEQPRKPGRNAGRGPFTHRKKPGLPQVYETKTARLQGCPGCGNALKAIRQHEQYVADIRPVQPVITRFVTCSGYCCRCHQRVRSQHPEQTSQATGAAGVLVGPLPLRYGEHISPEFQATLEACPGRTGQGSRNQTSICQWVDLSTVLVSGRNR